MTRAIGSIGKCKLKVVNWSSFAVVGEDRHLTVSLGVFWELFCVKLDAKLAQLINVVCVSRPLGLASKMRQGQCKHFACRYIFPFCQFAIKLEGCCKTLAHEFWVNFDYYHVIRRVYCHSKNWVKILILLVWGDDTQLWNFVFKEAAISTITQGCFSRESFEWNLDLATLNLFRMKKGLRDRVAHCLCIATWAEKVDLNIFKSWYRTS